MKQISILTIAALFSVTPAMAQSSNEARINETEDGYAVGFDDDPLSAAPFEQNGMRLLIRDGAQRTVLIRPRAHFLRELVQSAEDL